MRCILAFLAMMAMCAVFVTAYDVSAADDYSAALVEVDADSEIDIELANAAGVDQDASVDEELTADVEAEAEAEAEAGADVEVDVESEALQGVHADAYAEADADVGAFEEIDVDALFSAVETESANTEAANAASLEAMGVDEMPTDRQMPGDVALLPHAPGVAPAADEDKLPKNLLLGEDDEVDPNYERDVELWKKLTKEIRKAEGKLGVYRKWNRAAIRNVRRIKAQLTQTRGNQRTLTLAVNRLRQTRAESLHKIKQMKLQTDLEAAQKKMDEVRRYGDQIAVAKAELGTGADGLAGRVRTLQNGLQELRSAGQDV